jgi:hypothetical protein
MNGFLSDDYKVPSTSRYMKFQAGENRFRILGSFTDETAIMGLEYWKATPDGGRKPIRVAMGVAIPITELEENPKTGELDMPKHFWALPVYNYQDGQVQILEITQKTIQSSIRDLSKNKKWGNPGEYDIVVGKSGEGLETKYTVVPDPKEELSEVIKEAHKGTKINIMALFSGEDPFNSNEKVDVDEVDSGIEKLKKATPGKV